PQQFDFHIHLVCDHPGSKWPDLLNSVYQLSIGSPYQLTSGSDRSNGSRVRLWKQELQTLANDLGFPVRVCHFPPGTSKWNKIEHRLFSFISMNWRGRPLISHEVIVNLIGSTTTRSGLAVRAQLDTNIYPKGVKVPDDAFAAINIERDPFHGEWNYRISPRAQ
ncbi:ISAzo13-like element transposase-related protein, partial [Aromatoleum aromaticum]|uniref:ISAzo13-like element transposase-related protein n=1 Tax=Aromatoleum aromaticum TaxID=551760 RepID=UPI003D005D2C